MADVAEPVAEPLPTWTDKQRRAWRRPEKLTVSEWADKHRVLDEMFAAEPGAWNTARTPYMREWMDSGSCRWVRHVTLLASTQVGKTECLNNLVGYFVHQRPSPMMFVCARRDDLQTLGERRLLPMVLASPALRAEMTARKRDAKKRELAFRRCVIYLRAAQSPADLASVPVRVVVGDEADKWPRWTGKEANPWKLALERTRTFNHQSLAVLASTPTTRDGLIISSFEAGDRRRYNVRCPHCERWLVFAWPQVTWHKKRDTKPEQIRQWQEAWYECQHCQGRIDDRHKVAMVQDGVWCPEGFDVDVWIREGRAHDRASHRSYHIWAAYSPWLTWWQIVEEWLKSKDSPEDLQNFINSWLAEPWEERVDRVEDAALQACVLPGFHRGTVPEPALVLTAAVDVQERYEVWAVFAWARDEECWLVDTGQTNGFDELADVLCRNTWGARQMKVQCTLVDSRHRRAEVLDFARDWKSSGVRMIAGVSRDAPVPFGTIKIEKHPKTGAPLPKGIVIWTVEVAMFKDMLAGRLAAALEESEEPVRGRVHLPVDLTDEEVRQLGSEHKVVMRSGNRKKSIWMKRPGHNRNELWDLAVYNIAAARMHRLDTLRSDAVASNPRPPTRPQRGPAPSYPSLANRFDRRRR